MAGEFIVLPALKSEVPFFWPAYELPEPAFLKPH
jgi:hypothetical protein